MNKFIAKIVLFTILVACLIYLAFTQANGYTDPYYLRFTTSKQRSLVLGTSKSAQGIQPKIFKSVIKKDIYNYSFTLAHSPFGSTYFQSIKLKVLPDSKDGIFIVTVDPWSISSITDNPNDTINFRENNRCLGNTKKVDKNPNLIYLINNYNKLKYVETFMKTSVFLHDDGWLEVNPNMNAENLINTRIERSIKEYRHLLAVYNYSEVRLKYLIKIIDFLGQHGEVYLVRLPVHPKMFEIEMQLMPDFDTKIQNAIYSSAGYLDLTEFNSDYLFVDGNHLFKESGEKVTKEIAEWILKIEEQEYVSN